MYIAQCDRCNPTGLKETNVEETRHSGIGIVKLVKGCLTFSEQDEAG